MIIQMFGCEKKEVNSHILISKVSNLVALQRQIYLDKISLLLQLCSFNNILIISYLKKYKIKKQCFPVYSSLQFFQYTHTHHI